MNSIRVLLVDDHRVVVQGVHAILEREPDFEVVGEAATAEEALSLLQRHQPDVVVMDVSLRDTTGMQLARNVKSLCPTVRVVALTVHDDEEYIVGMIQAGADGYVVKSSSAAELVQAIRIVAQGQVLYPASAKRLLAQESSTPTRTPCTSTLTDREREILRLIATGATSREIAGQLFLSSKTVDNHRARILEKLQVRNKAEAVAHAIRDGVIPAEIRDRQPAVVTVVSGSGYADRRGSEPRRQPVHISMSQRYNGAERG